MSHMPLFALTPATGSVRLTVPWDHVPSDMQGRSVAEIMVVIAWFESNFKILSSSAALIGGVTRRGRSGYKYPASPALSPRSIFPSTTTRLSTLLISTVDHLLKSTSHLPRIFTLSIYRYTRLSIQRSIDSSICDSICLSMSILHLPCNLRIIYRDTHLSNDLVLLYPFVYTATSASISISI